LSGDVFASLTTSAVPSETHSLFAFAPRIDGITELWADRPDRALLFRYRHLRSPPAEPRAADNGCLHSLPTTSLNEPPPRVKRLGRYIERCSTCSDT
jgi:hypothetical protein